MRDHMSQTKKRILFITGTRADYGKLKPLITAVENDAEAFECELFVTGMHGMIRYGYTVDQILRDGWKKVYLHMNQIPGEPMEQIVANTISGLSKYIHNCKPDLIVAHGDRIEALAAATVGSLQNICTGHIEGGELSGTIDGVIRHAVTKLAHVHFVANGQAAARVEQLGESPESIHIIGSPDVDVMRSENLPSLEQVKARYEIPFEEYAVLMFHPVTTELDTLAETANKLVESLIASNRNYVVVYPNNDEGTDIIFQAYKKLEKHPNFRIYPSLRFEYFLTLLKYAKLIIGNSSAGIREAPVYGVPTINIGSRQNERFEHISIINLSGNDTQEIVSTIQNVWASKRFDPCYYFGEGNSAALFLEMLKRDSFWKIDLQKSFKTQHDFVESKTAVTRTQPFFHPSANPQL